MPGAMPSINSSASSSAKSGNETSVNQGDIMFAPVSIGGKSNGLNPWVIGGVVIAVVIIAIVWLKKK